MPLRWSFDELQPAHVAAGIGGADREFLSVCLGVFDDVTLSGQLKVAVQNVVKFARRSRISLPSVAASVQRTADKWHSNQGLTDDHLRAILWIRLQSALGVEPNFSRSVRGCERLTDDLVSTALRGTPEGLFKRMGEGVVASVHWGLDNLRRRSGDAHDISENDERSSEAMPKTLGTLVSPLLTEMVANALGEKSDMPQEDKERIVAETAARLDDAERQAILREAGDADFERALAKCLATGGVYGAIGGTVAASGFAPYILAAQASAFIPFVSGPGLVSLLSVLTNPVVVVVAVGGLGYHWLQTANERAAANVAAHLIALLACDGMRRGRSSIEELVGSFGTIPDLPDDAFRSREEMSRNQARWRELHSDSWLPAARSRPFLADEWERSGINGDSVSVAALSMGDLLYSLAAIDPQVVAAADFASSDEITNSFDFAVNLLARMDGRWRERESLEGLVNSTKGYVMEQLAATKLVADGHVVELPDAPNQPGLDLIVDGQPFQVKCLADSGGLAEHFHQYPGIPVIANSELIEDQVDWPVEWRDKVFFLEGHTNELISDVTERSVMETKDLGDNDVPEFALAYVAVRQLWKLKKGQVTAPEAASDLLIQGSTRAGLAVAGGFVGKSIGLLVLGPAGALVGGALGPVVAQAGAGRLAPRIRKAVRLRPKVDRGIDDTCDALSHDVEKAIDQMLAVLRRKHRLIGSGVAGTYVRHRVIDEARHLDECQGELLRLRCDPWGARSRAVSMLRIASRSVHPSRYQGTLRDLLDALRRS